MHLILFEVAIPALTPTVYVVWQDTHTPLRWTDTLYIHMHSLKSIWLISETESYCTGTTVYVCTGNSMQMIWK